MKRLMRLGSGLLVACAAAVVVAGEIKSGLQVGDGPPPFDVRNVTGAKCNDFAKDERPWVEALCTIIADNADLLAKGQDASFQNKVHLAMQAKGFGESKERGEPNGQAG